jgi:hypothetical protein
VFKEATVLITRFSVNEFQDGLEEGQLAAFGFTNTLWSQSIYACLVALASRPMARPGFTITVTLRASYCSLDRLSTLLGSNRRIDTAHDDGLSECS